MGLIWLIIVFSCVAGLGIGCFFTANCLQRDTMYEALKLRPFSTDILLPMGLSILMAAGSGLIVNYLCSAWVLDNTFIASAYGLVMAVGGGSAFIASAITTAAALRHRETLVDSD